MIVDSYNFLLDATIDVDQDTAQASKAAIK